MQLLFRPTKIIGLALLLLFINLNTSDAATNTWLAGPGVIGNWDNPAFWSLGIIPTASDEVIINSGLVLIPAGFAAEATNIKIGINGRLVVAFQATLHIEGARDKAGILNEGRVKVNGGLEILDIRQLDSIPDYSNGITNKFDFRIGINGTVDIIDVSNIGFYNETTNSSLKNKGDLVIDNCGLYGLNNNGLVNNFDVISISITANNALAAILNTRTFNSSTQALIDLSGGQNGFINIGPSATVLNRNDFFFYRSYFLRRIK